MERSQRAFAYERPDTKYISSLQRWIRGNSCIARNEAKFLGSGEDLLTLEPSEDGAVSWLERFVCDALVGIFKVKNPHGFVTFVYLRGLRKTENNLVVGFLWSKVKRPSRPYILPVINNQGGTRAPKPSHRGSFAGASNHMYFFK